MKTIMVTPTFSLDYRRCKRLVKSVRKHVTGLEKHVLIVDAADQQVFADLAGEGVEIISKESCLEIPFIMRLPLQKKWWISGSTLPVRGWILQQVVKLAYAYNASADAILYADSDVVFVDHFDAQQLWHGNRLRCFQTPRRPHHYSDRRHANWYNYGVKSLGLDPQADHASAYIAQLNTMRPDVVRSMCNRIEYNSHASWQRTLLNSLDFSEFILYGLHVESSDYAKQRHFFDEAQLCHSSWFYEINNWQDTESFLSKRHRSQVAIHLQSNLKTDFGDILSETFSKQAKIA